MGESATSTSSPPENEFDTKPREQFSWQRQEEKKPRSALSRTCSSVSRSNSSATLKRTFSIRRSTSVREGGYRRIHEGLADDPKDHAGDRDGGDEEEEEEEEEHLQESPQRKASTSGKKKGKFRRACKKLFGF